MNPPNTNLANSGEKAKLTKREKEIVNKLNDGWEIFVGVSDYNGTVYYNLSKDFDNDYIRSDVFSNLIEKGVIYQNARGNYWELTPEYED